MLPSAARPCLKFNIGSRTSARTKIRAPQKSGVRRRVVSKRGGFGGCSPRNKNRNEGTFAKTTLLRNRPFISQMSLFGVDKRVVSKRGGFGGCSPGTKAGTRVRSPKPPFYETALLSPSEKGPEKWCRAKAVEKCQKTVCRFLTIFDVLCPARKLSKSVEQLFDTF